MFLRSTFSLQLWLASGFLSTLAISSTLPTPAQAQTFSVTDGRESIRLVPETLEILEDVGLTIRTPVSTAVPAEGFDFGLQLIPPDSPELRRTNLTIEAINLGGEVQSIPLGGFESLDTTLIFDVDTAKLDLDPVLEFDNFSTFFPNFFLEPNPQLFVAQEDLQRQPALRLFDVDVLGLNSVDLAAQTLVLEDIELTIAQEFNDFLQAAGSEIDTTGLLFIEGRADRNLQEVMATEVPDLSSNLWGFILVGTLMGSRKLLKGVW